MIKFSKNKSFTLIELLVVVAIMGLLASLATVALNHARAKSRDTRRVADLCQFSKAMEMHFNDYYAFPDTDGVKCLSVCESETPPSWCTNFKEIVKVIPDDPMQTSLQNCYLISSNEKNYRIAAHLEKDTDKMKDDGGSYLQFYEVYSDPTAPLLTDWDDPEIGPWQGQVMGWFCGDSLTYEGQDYTTVYIGTQCWFAEHLNVGTKILGSQDQGTSCSSIEKYCYNDDETYCTSDGALYQWAQAMCGSTTEGAQGICPDGWHIPTDNEWMTLEEYLGMCSGTDAGCSGATNWRGTDQGNQLKIASDCYTGGGEANCGTSGFESLLAGYRLTNGLFYYRGTIASIWSSLQSDGGAWRRNLYSGHATVHRYADGKLGGFSVRCLKD